MFSNFKRNYNYVYGNKFVSSVAFEHFKHQIKEHGKQNDIGALIVLSNDNLPEGIIESGTVINAQITSQMIEAVVHHKYDERVHEDYYYGYVRSKAGNRKYYSAENNYNYVYGNKFVNKKKYADAADLKNALSEYYWSDLTAEGKL